MVFWDLAMSVISSDQSSHAHAKKKKKPTIWDICITHRPEDTYRSAQTHIEVLILALN